MAGYYNYSMSNNAVEAYERGEMPISKWSKSEIINGINEIIEYEHITPKFEIEKLKKLTVSELRDTFLASAGWHHTSSKYNRTYFYAISDLMVDEFTNEDIEKIISNREPRLKKVKEKVKKITAEIQYVVWVGNYTRYKRPKYYTETVTYLSTDKMVKTEYGGNKRISCLEKIKVLNEVEI